jgi:hypothetical protein
MFCCSLMGISGIPLAGFAHPVVCELLMETNRVPLIGVRLAGAGPGRRNIK